MNPFFLSAVLTQQEAVSCKTWRKNTAIRREERIILVALIALITPGRKNSYFCTSKKQQLPGE